MAETANPSFPVVTDLCCAKCGVDWPIKGFPVTLPAREVGGGSVCVSCPDCGSDLAVFRA